VTADYVHLVRHGEVNNPKGILYGQLPGYGLTDFGRTLAENSTELLADVQVVKLVVSPLQRARESVEPWEDRTGLTAEIDERVIEPWNDFEGLNLRRGATIARNPRLWLSVWNPFRPSWGEPYSSIARRMFEAIREAADSVPSGHVVIVSHQLPIWMVHRRINRMTLWHNPSRRRCALSSITSFRVDATVAGDFDLVEVDYQEPRGTNRARDLGAV
jgi:broad specificity phosphatase PhoE